MRISQRAFDLTVAEEVSGKAFYIQHYQRPEWPGLSSGVTVGIGYDLGQSSRDKIAADWSTLVTSNMLSVMQSCSGITGYAGKAKCAEVRNSILITWDMAMSVFASRDVPQWTAAVLKAVPGADQLNGDLLGVLVDIAYNRGVGGFNSNNYRFQEMKAIRNEVGVKELNMVPKEIQSMKRLWPNTSGLLRRCDHRIALWNYGMTQLQGPTAEVVAAMVPMSLNSNPDFMLKEGPARTKPSPTSKAQNATMTAIAVGGVALSMTMDSNMTSSIVVAASLSLSIAVWMFWYRWRNPKPDFPLEVLT